jgi:hypothetical protein
MYTIHVTTADLTAFSRILERAVNYEDDTKILINDECPKFPEDTTTAVKFLSATLTAEQSNMYPKARRFILGGVHQQNKLRVIKAIREVTRMGLKEAYDITTVAEHGDSPQFQFTYEEREALEAIFNSAPVITSVYTKEIFWSTNNYNKERA